MIAKKEYLLLLDKCKKLPPAKGFYLENDYIINLFLTVLDFRLKSNIVKAAIDHYRTKHWEDIRTFYDLKLFLKSYNDNVGENTEAAYYLWGYRYWTRLSLLRKLLDYFESIHVLTQEELIQWARKSNYTDDFKGKIPGMAFAVYQWLVMRQGVETIKPDVHLKCFIESIVNYNITDKEIVSTLENISCELGLKAYDLDWRIWEKAGGRFFCLQTPHRYDRMPVRCLLCREQREKKAQRESTILSSEESTGSPYLLMKKIMKNSCKLWHDAKKSADLNYMDIA